jgi:hypothetical protein
MAKKDAIVYFITDEERAAAKQATPDASETESFLVGQLDPDWNVLLPELSERIIGEQVGDSYFKHACLAWVFEE